jgi:exo-beta-1,3-glucanase (GH17 family)
MQKLILRLSSLLCISLTTMVSAKASTYSPSDLGYGIDYQASHYYDPLNSTVPDNQLNNDFSVLSKHFNTIRTYAMSIFSTYRTVREAQRYNMNVVISLGWSYGDEKYFNQQFKLFKNLFTQYPELQKSIRAVIVGNEVLTKPMADDKNGIKTWISDVAKVRQWVNSNWKYSPLPFVTVSERADVLEGYPKIVEDLPQGVPVFANIYPFWGGCSVDMATGKVTPTGECKDSGGSLQQRWNKLSSSIKSDTGNHPVIIGETGWPTDGNPGIIPGTTEKTVKPTLKDAQIYWNYIYGKGEGHDSQANSFMAKNPGVVLFAFSAFDEPIKGSLSPNDLRHYWGFYTWLDNEKGKKPSAGVPVPLNKSVSPAVKQGTYVNFVVTNDLPSSPVAWAKHISISNDSNTYTYDQWDANSSTTIINGSKVADGTTGYPWIEYNNLVTIEYNDGATNIKCANTLKSGDGISGKLTDITKSSIGLPDLVWGTPPASEPSWCNEITWSNAGVFMPAAQPTN